MTINTDILKNTAGLVMWLDGEINSRAGVRDTSINGMQNLVHSPIAGKSNTNGFYEKFNGTATFNEKGCKLGGTCHYPSYHIADDITVEFVIDLGQYALEANKVHMILDHRYSASGFQVVVREEPELNRCHVVFDCGNGSTPQTKLLRAFTPNTKIYCAMTSKLSVANSTKIYLDGKIAETIGTDEVAKPKDTIRALALGGMSSSSMNTSTPTTSNQWGMGAFYTPNDYFHTVRLWNRQLSEKEVLDNYKRDLERFGA